MDNDSLNLKEILLHSLRGLAFTLAFTAISSVIVCAVLTNSRDPKAILCPISLGILLLSSALGGIFSSIKNDQPILSATICSIFHLFIVLIGSISLPTSENALPVLLKTIICVLIIAVSVISSYLTSMGKYNRKRSKLRKKYRS
ncbi:MAG: hypothetical protein IJZ89_06060 [Clostridia bacterium]|nr:hypothetical protein [Clostridia bacterium]